MKRWLASGAWWLALAGTAIAQIAPSGRMAVTSTNLDNGSLAAWLASLAVGSGANTATLDSLTGLTSSRDIEFPDASVVLLGQTSWVATITSGSTQNTLTANIPGPFPTTPIGAAGYVVGFFPVASYNSGAVTLALSVATPSGTQNLSAMPVTKCGTAALVAGDILANVFAWGVIDGSGNLEIQDPQAAGCPAPLALNGAGSTILSAASSGITSTTFTGMGLTMPTVPAGTMLRGTCDIAWRASSTSYTVTFGVVASSAPTFLDVIATMYGTSYVAPTITTITGTTATAVLGAITPAATNTLYWVHLVLEIKSTSAQIAVSPQVEVSSASETVTIGAGSSCGWLP